MRLGLYATVVRDRLRSGQFRDLLREAMAIVYSDTASVVVRKDLSDDVSEAREGEAAIRLASPTDVATLLDAERDGDGDAGDLWERRLRLHIVASIGIEGCFVADTEGVKPAFMQYLFSAKDNDRLRAGFGGLFPVLSADEALVEFLYVAPKARNPGLAIKSLVQVTEEARRQGATSVISFIDPDNKGALFMNHLAGFRAHAVRRRRKRLARSTYTFEDWPAGSSQALDDVASGKTAIS